MPQRIQQWIWSSGLLLTGFAVMALSLHALHQERLFPQTARADEGRFVVEPTSTWVKAVDPHMPGSVSYMALRIVDRGRLEMSHEKHRLALAMAHERIEAAQYALARGEALIAWSTLHKGFGYLHAALHCSGDECPAPELTADTCDDMERALRVFVGNVGDDDLRARASTLEEQRQQVCNFSTQSQG